MKKIVSFITILLACIMLCACGQASNEMKSDTETEVGTKAEETDQQSENEGSNPQMSYEQITQEEAKKIMASEEGYIILDVRTQLEYADGHIPGAICVPNETIYDEMPAELPEKDQLILVYCRSGNRSRQAAQKLAALGYTNIKEFGGIMTWDGDIEQ